VFGLLLPFLFLVSGSLNASTEISIQNSVCRVVFDPVTLAVTLQSGSHPAILVSSVQTNLGNVAGLERSAIRARWSLPERKISVTLELEGSRLLAHVLAAEPGEFTFPVIAETASNGSPQRDGPAHHLWR
jgi:hypothetical protein